MNTITIERYEQKKAEILAKLIDDQPEQPVSTVNLEKIQALFNTDIETLYADFTEEERRRFWRGILKKVYVTDNEIVDVDFIE